eukprot:6201650-Pleurochrysis_carterae.AAC.3
MQALSVEHGTEAASTGNSPFPRAYQSTIHMFACKLSATTLAQLLSLLTQDDGASASACACATPLSVYPACTSRAAQHAHLHSFLLN